MVLLPYTATALSRYDIPDTPNNRNVVQGAIVRVFDLQGVQQTIYDDDTGAGGELQKVTNLDGQRTFYIEPGSYTVDVNGRQSSVNIADASKVRTAIQPVASVADLRLLEATFDGQQVSLTSYYDGWASTIRGPQGGGVFVWDAGNTAVDDGGAVIAVTGVATGRWVRRMHGKVYASMFGAREDYSYSSDTGTDDLAAINAALAYVDSDRDGATNGEVSITYQSLISDTVVLPKGCVLSGEFAPNGTDNQVGAPTWPLSVGTGSALIGSHASGPVVLIRDSDSWLKNLDIGSTQVRYAAAISSGAQNVNAGLVIETDDSPSSVIARSGAVNCVFRNQPADGWYGAGHLVTIRMDRCVQMNVGRHGFALDHGYLSGRTNKFRPGIVTIIAPRSINTGGHGMAIGDPSSGFDVPFRVVVIEYEGFRGGNNPAHLYRSSNAYIRATDVTVIESAASGTSGTSGAVATLDYSYAVSGRAIQMIGNRFISYVKNPMLIFSDGLTNIGITVQGASPSTDAPLQPNFVDVQATVTDLSIRGVNTGGFTGDALNLSQFSLSSTNIDCIYNGVHQKLRDRHNRLEAAAFTSKIQSIPDDGFIYLPLSGASCHGMLQVNGSTSTRGSAKVHFRAGSAAFCTLVDSSGVAIGVGTVALGGTTGADGQLNIAATANGVYIENRTGATGNYALAFTAVNFDNGDIVA